MSTTSEGGIRESDARSGKEPSGPFVLKRLLRGPATAWQIWDETGRTKRYATIHHTLKELERLEMVELVEGPQQRRKRVYRIPVWMENLNFSWVRAQVFLEKLALWVKSQGCLPQEDRLNGLTMLLVEHTVQYSQESLLNTELIFLEKILESYLIRRRLSALSTGWNMILYTYVKNNGITKADFAVTKETSPYFMVLDHWKPALDLGTKGLTGPMIRLVSPKSRAQRAKWRTEIYGGLSKEMESFETKDEIPSQKFAERAFAEYRELVRRILPILR